MKKKLMSLTALVLSLVMLQVTTFASTQASEVIRQMSGSMTAIGDNEISINFFILGRKNLEMIGVSKIEVYSESGQLLDTYRYFEDGYENMMGYDTTNYNSEVIFEGERGETYYAKLTFYASDGSLTDMATYITNSEEAY